MKLFVITNPIDQPSNKPYNGKFRTNSFALLLIFIILLTGFSVSAQQNSVGNVLEVKAFLTSLSQQNASDRNSESDATIHLKQLIKDVQPAVYLTNGIVKSYGESPVVLYTDINSLGTVGISDLKRANIEIITVYINTASDLSGLINTATFTGFPNLKYIYIISNVAATDAAIIQMVQNSNPDYSVFYKIEKGA